MYRSKTALQVVTVGLIWKGHLHIPCPQAPLYLAGSDGVHCMCSPDLLYRSLRDAKILYLALLHQLLHIRLHCEKV